MGKFTDDDFDLLHRHYWVIRIFGFEWWIWNTSPQRVLEHLKELKTCKHSNRQTTFECYQDRYVHERCNECGADIYSDL